MAEPKRILSFGAHPDDTEFYCGGTLALLRQAGWEVASATVSGGGGGSHEYSLEKTRRIRMAECQDAADVIGAEYYYAGGQDMDVDYCHELRVKVVHVFRQFRPDVVITCPPQDYHPDHEETSRLVRAACFFAPIPNFPEQTLEPIATVPHLYYMDPRRDIFGGRPPVHFFVDISSVTDTKEQMAACHQSQRDWIKRHHGTDNWIEHLKELDAESGRQAGTDAAEGFVQHLGNGYPHDNILAEALGDKIRK